MGLKMVLMKNGLQNGKPKTIGDYLNDDSTDSWTKWYENGQKEIEGTYKDVDKRWIMD